MKNAVEWSREFDLMWDNITSHQAPGLEEFEKGIFLTRGQEKVVLKIAAGEFESTEQITVLLAPLVSQVEYSGEPEDTGLQKICTASKIYTLPSDLLFRTYESCVLSVDGCGLIDAEVVPVTQDEFSRTMRNPFKRANKKRVLRLAYAETDVESGVTAVNAKIAVTNYSEIIAAYPIHSYTVRYIRKPDPIVLETDIDGKTIDGLNAPNPCKLNEALHQAILTEAVQMAKAAWLS